MAVLLETSVGDLTIDLMTEDRPQGEISFLVIVISAFYSTSSKIIGLVRFIFH